MGHFKMAYSCNSNILISSNFLQSSKSGKSPCTIVHGLGQILSKMKSKEFYIFIFFPDTYTCIYVVFQV